MSESSVITPAMCSFCQRYSVRYRFKSKYDTEHEVCARCNRYGGNQKNMMAGRIIDGLPAIEAPEHARFYNDHLPSVYFIQERAPEKWPVAGGGQYGGPIKIGWADTPWKRLLALQSGNPRPLEIIGLITDCDMLFEKDVHKKFAHLRIRGEWFIDGDDLIDFIRETCYQPQENVGGE